MATLVGTGTETRSPRGRAGGPAAVLAAVAVTVVAVTPVTPVDAAQQDDSQPPACPVDPPAADFADGDVIPNAHRDNVDCAAFFAIARGFSDGTYRPAAAVKRGQMASFVARALEAAKVSLPPADRAAGFTDVSPDDPHAEDIARLQAAGVVRGGPGDREADEYGPGLPVRRDQMASYLVRAAEYAYSEDFGSDTRYFPDVPPDNPHYENVNFGVENETILGFDAGLFDEDHFDEPFRPSAHTRRDQMASFVVRLLRFLTVPVEVALTDGAPDAGVGETVTVTATVFTQFRGMADNEGRFPDGARVTFRADGPALSDEETVESDESGQADFSFVAHETGTVTVTASIPGPGGAFVDADGARDTSQVRVERPGG